MFFKKKRKVIYIDGLHCEHCKKKVEDALENLVDVDDVSVQLKKGCATVRYEHDVDDVLLTKTVEELGYVVTGIKELS